MEQREIVAIVDHTLLLQTATWEESKAICACMGRTEI